MKKTMLNIVFCVRSKKNWLQQLRMRQMRMTPTAQPRPM